jgi:hypothetical protein
MSPYRFGSTRTSNPPGADELHAESVHEHLARRDLRVSFATSRKTERNRPSVNFMMFAFVTHATSRRWWARA